MKRREEKRREEKRREEKRREEKRREEKRREEKRRQRVQVIGAVRLPTDGADPAQHCSLGHRSLTSLAESTCARACGVSCVCVCMVSQ